MPQAPTPVKRYHETLLQTVRDIGLHQKWFTSPINLGGVGGAGGGSGIPIGGIIGQLIQTKVAYDTTEAAILNPPVSGRSLLDNLNTIRHRINVAGEPLIVEEDNVEKASGVVYLNFIGDILVTSPDSPGSATKHPRVSLRLAVPPPTTSYPNVGSTFTGYKALFKNS